MYAEVVPVYIYSACLIVISFTNIFQRIDQSNCLYRNHLFSYPHWKRWKTKRMSDLVCANNLSLHMTQLVQNWHTLHVNTRFGASSNFHSHNWVAPVSRKFKSPSNFFPWKSKGFFILRVLTWSHIRAKWQSRQ